MAQRTGTAILALARDIAGDNDAAGNFGVGAAAALLKLNDVLMRWTTNVKSKPIYIAATTTGLSFSSGDVYKETSDNTAATKRITAFHSFHEAAANTLSFPLPPALDVKTVDEIRALLNYDGDTALSPQANHWECVAYEKTQDATAAGADKWRVWAYPVINRTRHMTVLATAYTQIGAIGDIPDIDEHDANAVARFLAWELGKANRIPQAHLDAILAPLDPTIVQQMHGGVIASTPLQDSVDWRDW
jgi:hypothetical protein